ncbi:hypothetical protein [Polaromonas sp. YR568]|uniref:hypothetical protein n=1 Tax=Polaromonas sp. YR568 TaxID=1855301 RepID=UPI00398BE48E
MSKPQLSSSDVPRGRLARISRPKLLGFVRHEGVLMPDGRVVHTSPDGGTRICSYAEFRAGLEVNVEYELPIHRHADALAVLNRLLAANAPYDLIANNCEIFARKVMLEKPVSPQLGFWAVAGLCAAAWCMTR